jgi:hypothetical protein
MALEPDQAIAVVASGEPFMLLPFVLENTLEEVARYSNIEGVAAAGHDVRAVGVLVHWLIVRFVGEEEWDEEQPQIPHCVRDDNVFWGVRGGLPVIQKLYHYTLSRESREPHHATP